MSRSEADLAHLYCWEGGTPHSRDPRPFIWETVRGLEIQITHEKNIQIQIHTNGEMTHNLTDLLFRGFECLFAVPLNKEAMLGCSCGMMGELMEGSPPEAVVISC